MERTCPHLRSAMAQGVNSEATKSLHPSGVTQWQEFLTTLDPPDPGRGNHQRAELWDDPKTFLASFEQVAEACRWPRQEWVARLLPALDGDAERAFRSLQARDRGDYGKVKAAILRGDALRMEEQRQHFRHFSCQEVEDPREVYHQLQELCHRWLRPEKHTKEQILGFLILEQFLAVLPPEIQTGTQEHVPSGVQMVSLPEDFMTSHPEAERENWQAPFHEITVELEEDLAGSSWRQDYQENDQEIVSINDEPPLHSCLLFYPSDGQGEADRDMPEESGDLTSVGLFSDQLEQTVQNPAQAPMYWEVTQGKPQLTDSQEGLLIPKPSLPSTEQEPEVVFIQMNEGEEAFPVSDSGNGITESEEQPRCILIGAETEGQALLGKASERSLGMPFRLHNQDCEAPFSQWRAELEGDHRAPAGLVEIQAAPTRGSGKARSRRSSHPKGRRAHCLDSGLVADRTTQTGKSPYECLVCERIFRNKSHLTRHQRIHTGEKPYQCAECGKAFSRKDKLVGHQRTHHARRQPFQGLGVEQGFSLTRAPNSEGRPYGCPECGKHFPTASLLKRHRKVHGAKKSYECAKCRGRFRWISALERHQKTHERLFECLECGKTFDQAEALCRHQAAHTGQRRYECSRCGQGFEQRENMVRHERTHAEEKDPCSGCEKSFGWRDAMPRHQRTHEEEKRSVKQERDCG